MAPTHTLDVPGNAARAGALSTGDVNSDGFAGLGIIGPGVSGLAPGADATRRAVLMEVDQTKGEGASAPGAPDREALNRPSSKRHRRVLG